MAFKMKGYAYPGKSPMKATTDPKKIGNKPGAKMDESNSSAEMRRLAALDTGVEYAADESNLEWQRRRDLNKARLAYGKTLGAPTGADVMEAEARRLATD